MRLFRSRTGHHHSVWKRDTTGRAYASHGRFRLTINGANERWFYRVSDMNGELPSVDSNPFPTERETMKAVQAELDATAGELPPLPEY
ncbi:hypothetical protein [Rhizobium sp. AN80A]|uniref:hypothetical protein n=1 Tax=Rhizobium sp. AN80A TaxID=3040673 RepID=UPI0024B37F8B|nr:hypothetical protein [Rhizobium sp. AN80A]